MSNDLRSLVRHAAKEATYTPDFELLAARGRRRRATARVAALALAAGALVVGGILMWPQNGRPLPVVGSAPDPTSTVAPGWSPIPAGPLSPRSFAVGAWTGTEFIVVGGVGGEACLAGASCAVAPSALADGAAYRPDTRTWRRIAGAPTPLSWGEAVTVDGVVYLLAGTHRGEALLSYDPGSDVWSELALPPGVTPGLAPAGGAVVAFARSRGPDQLGATLDHRLDLATGEWTPLPVDPVGVAANRQMVWLNEALVLLTEAVPSGEGTPFVSAAELDPISGSWKFHDRADRTTNLSPWVVAGEVAVNPYGPKSVVNGQPGFPSGGIFEDGDIRVLPDTDLPWRELPGLPVAGDRYVIGHRGVLDVQTRVWTSLDPPSELADEGTATVWAGDRLLTWGGTRFGDIDTPSRTGGGWQYQPSPEDR